MLSEWKNKIRLAKRETFITVTMGIPCDERTDGSMHYNFLYPIRFVCSIFVEMLINHTEHRFISNDAIHMDQSSQTDVGEKCARTTTTKKIVNECENVPYILYGRKGNQSKQYKYINTHIKNSKCHACMPTSNRLMQMCEFECWFFCSRIFIFSNENKAISSFLFVLWQANANVAPSNVEQKGQKSVSNNVCNSEWVSMDSILWNR